MKSKITVIVDRVIGPFVDDALEQSTEAPTPEGTRKRVAKKPKTTVKQRKKPGVASDEAQRRRQRKNRR